MERKTEKQTVFIVDDEPEVLESFAMIFESKGFRVITAASGKEALERFSDEPVPVIVCDNSLPDAQGIDLLKEFRAILPEVQMIMVTGKGTIGIAVSAMKAGMFDFTTKPVSPDYLVNLVVRAHQLHEALSDRRKLMEEMERMTEKFFVGKHPSVKNLLRIINTAAPSDATVLIEGESGTGKELVARLIHQRSRRSSGPFVAVDCGAIPEGLVESELFGHEKGAFTGAVSSKPGKFERAHRGTLFLDEITNLPLASQAKLLRALQEMTVERVGGVKQIPVDIRLVAATNIPFQDALKEKLVREDLYYRLNIVKLRIPPLRQRKSDILPLAMHFIEKHRERRKSQASGISREALAALMEHSWPGNVRELENTIEHALVMAGSSQIQVHDLPPLGEAYYTRDENGASVSQLEEMEREMLIRAIRDSGGNKFQAARLLGIPRSSLYSKLKKFGIQKE